MSSSREAANGELTKSSSVFIVALRAASSLPDDIYEQIPDTSSRVLGEVMEHKILLLLLEHPASRAHTIRTLKELSARVSKIEEAQPKLINAAFKLLMNLYFRSTDQLRAELMNDFVVEVSDPRLLLEEMGRTDCFVFRYFRVF